MKSDSLKQTILERLSDEQWVLLWEVWPAYLYEGNVARGRLVKAISALADAKDSERNPLTSFLTYLDRGEFECASRAYELLSDHEAIRERRLKLADEETEARERYRRLADRVNRALQKDYHEERAIERKTGEELKVKLQAAADLAGKRRFGPAHDELESALGALEEHRKARKHAIERWLDDVKRWLDDEKMVPPGSLYRDEMRKCLGHVEKYLETSDLERADDFLHRFRRFAEAAPTDQDRGWLDVSSTAGNLPARLVPLDETDRSLPLKAFCHHFAEADEGTLRAAEAWLRLREGVNPSAVPSNLATLHGWLGDQHLETDEIQRYVHSRRGRQEAFPTLFFWEMDYPRTILPQLQSSSQRPIAMFWVPHNMEKDAGAYQMNVEDLRRFFARDTVPYAGPSARTPRIGRPPGNLARLGFEQRRIFNLLIVPQLLSPGERAALTQTTHTLVLDEGLFKQLTRLPARQRMKAFVLEALRYMPCFEGNGPVACPYSFSEVMRENPLFMGRAEELRRIFGAERSPVAVHGSRKIGKSSLLRRTEEMALRGEPADGLDTSHFLVVFTEYNLQGETVEEKRCHLARQIYRQFWHQQQKVRAYRQSRGLECPEAIRWPGQPVGVETPEAIHLHDAVDLTEQAIARWLQANPQWTLLVLIDEADNLAQATANMRESPISILRNWSSAHRVGTRDRFRFILAGYKELHENLNRDPALKDLKDMRPPIRLKPLDNREARQLVLEPHYYLGMEFESDLDLDALVMASGQHPNTLQALCKTLQSNLNERRESCRRRGELCRITHEDISTLTSKPAAGTPYDQDPTLATLRINLDTYPRMAILAYALMHWHHVEGGPFTPIGCFNGIRALFDAVDREYEQLMEQIFRDVREVADAMEELTTLGLLEEVEEIVGAVVEKETLADKRYQIYYRTFRVMETRFPMAEESSVVRMIERQLAEIQRADRAPIPNPWRPWRNQTAFAALPKGWQDQPVPEIPGYRAGYLHWRGTRLAGAAAGTPDPEPWVDELAGFDEAAVQRLSIDWRAPVRPEGWHLQPYSRDDVDDLLQYNQIPAEQGLSKQLWLKSGGWPELLFGYFTFIQADGGGKRLKDSHLMAERPPWAEPRGEQDPLRHAFDPKDRRAWFLELPRLLAATADEPWRGERDDLLLPLMERHGDDLFAELEAALDLWIACGWLAASGTGDGSGTERITVPTAESWTYWLVEQELLRAGP